MFDQYTSLDQLINQNPDIENILNSYGIPYHNKIDKNNKTTLEEISMIYGIDVDEIIKEINGSRGTNNLF